MRRCGAADVCTCDTSGLAALETMPDEDTGSRIVLCALHEDP